MSRRLTPPLLSALVLTLCLSTVHAQYAKPVFPQVETQSAYPTGDALVSPLQHAALFKEVDHHQVTMRWANKLTRVSARNHDLPEVQAIKAAKLADKLASSRPTGTMPLGMAKAVTPVVGSNFEANWSLNQTPPDNSMAISNGGLIVTANNDEVLYMNTSGALLQFLSWSDFVNDPSLTANIYDPKVIYDSQADRFVMAVLHGSTAAASKVLLCFSKSNDPMAGWWIYQLTGNPLNDNSWFDYPSVGVSNNEVYVTGNLFSSGANQFNQAVLYQVQKAQGFNGGNLNWQFWSGMTSSPYAAFTLQPASWGQQGNYGPGILLVSNAAGGSNQIRVWDLTNDLGSSPQLNSFTTTVPTYSPAADAQQAGSNDLLSNGDCRLMNAFYLTGQLHYVHGFDIGNGWNGIRYNRTDVSNLTTQQNSFGAVGVADVSYPAVASYATTATDHSVMIGFEATSSQLFPEVHVVNCDNALQFSNSTLVKQGETFVDFIQGGTERWGDYSGIARKHNEAQPRVWMAACYGADIPQGSASNTWKTWVAEVGGGVITEVPSVAVGRDGMRVYPNPLMDYFHLEFQLQDREAIRIELVDAKGALVKLLFEETTSPGEYRFTFNRGALSPGTYSLLLRSPEKIIAHETVVVDQ